MICRSPRYIHRNPTDSECFLGSHRDTGYFDRTVDNMSPNILLQVGCSRRADGTNDISDTCQIKHSVAGLRGEIDMLMLTK